MKKIMLGNEAVARGAYEAGATVAAAYPGTPSTEITEYLSTYDDIYSEWSPNEKVALEVAIGSSIGGARTICSMKHVGLNVAADPLFTVSYTGVNGGLVIMVADDPGMHSSQNEQDTRLLALASKVPLLEPSDSQECKDFVKKAFELSEQFDTPFIVRLTTRVAHSKSIVEIEEKSNYTLKEYKKDFNKYVMMPAMARKRHFVVEQRLADLTNYSNESPLNSIEWNSKKVGVITSGIDYQYSKEVFPDASFLKIGMVYPLPEKKIAEFASQVETLYVIEALEPFIENKIRQMGIKVIGKDKLPITGEFSSNLIREKLFGEKFDQPNIESNIPVRPPVMCPGCSHRSVYYTLKKLKLNVTGDIGCYTLGALPPTETMDTCVCMGASVGMAHGMEKARGKDFAKKTVGILGDSTFIHSGITGLIDIVYNKGISTIIILDNSITGMTGHQQNPSTGLTIKGEPTIAINFVKLAEGIGILPENIRVVDPFEIKEFEDIVKEETAKEMPSLIIAQRPCVLKKGTKPKTPFRISQDLCKKCKACLGIGCPSIVSKNGTIEINETICHGCGLCVKLCKFNAINRAGE